MLKYGTIGARGALSRRSEGGFTIIELLFVSFIIVILMAIALPSYVKFVQQARETAVIAYISKVVKAEEVYRAENATTDYTGDFEELETTALVPNATGSASRVAHDYRFDLVAGSDGGGNPFWTINARPVNSSTEVRWFYSDQTGVIRYEVGGPAGASSPHI